MGAGWGAEGRGGRGLRAPRGGPRATAPAPGARTNPPRGPRPRRTLRGLLSCQSVDEADYWYSALLRLPGTDAARPDRVVAMLSTRKDVSKSDMRDMRDVLASVYRSRGAAPAGEGGAGAFAGTPGAALPRTPEHAAAPGPGPGAAGDAGEEFYPPTVLRGAGAAGDGLLARLEEEGGDGKQTRHKRTRTLLGLLGRKKRGDDAGGAPATPAPEGRQ